MKLRKFKKPIMPMDRVCTKSLSADSHRMLNACALAWWRRPLRWDDSE